MGPLEIPSINFVDGITIVLNKFLVFSIFYELVIKFKGQIRFRIMTLMQDYQHRCIKRTKMNKIRNILKTKNFPKLKKDRIPQVKCIYTKY